MTTFDLHARLAQDCFVLGEGEISLLLLLKNALYPWFIIVPKVDQTELYQLETALQQEIMLQVNNLSRFLKQELKVHKVNIAAIGNLVPQLHIHVIGRKENDPAWPGVVWGHGDKKDYSKANLEDLIKRLGSYAQPYWKL